MSEFAIRHKKTSLKYLYYKERLYINISGELVTLLSAKCMCKKKTATLLIYNGFPPTDYGDFFSKRD